MVHRLKPLMDSLITSFQNAFILGRNIANNILIAHEIFGYLDKKRGKKKCFGALKIDMTKAYDRVDWSFLKVALLAMNFNDRWVQWFMECVTSVDANLNRHALRPNKQYWNNCPRKLKFRFLIENPEF